MFVVTVGATTVTATTDCDFDIIWSGAAVPAGTTGFYPVIDQAPDTATDGTYTGVTNTTGGMAGLYFQHSDGAKILTAVNGVYPDFDFGCHISPSATWTTGTYAFFVRMNWLTAP
jgi:hypothetical protein